MAYEILYYLKAFVSVNNGAEVIIHKLNKGKVRQRLLYCKSKQGVMNRKVNHKHSRSSPDKQSNFNNKIEHGGKPLSFSVYIISHLTVKKQQSLGKVCVKLLAGPFLNIKLTTIKDGR